MLYMTEAGTEVYLVNGKVVKQPSEQRYRKAEQIHSDK